ncbi:MAG: XRE family transcriptional regulator [Spirochaetia bacterium]|jgi:transcriptional regulator with XRE-family HTH domain|nr:XRE family transcriptional regulator [Spirochaetia bacterium]
MIGDKIRKTRKAKEITLSQLAELCGLTASYISQVERNLAEPSISSLRKISAALQLPLYSFLEETSEVTQVIRADQRKQLKLTDSNIVYEFLSPFGPSEHETPSLEVFYFSLKPKSWTRDEYSSRAAEECIIVLSGELVLDCVDETFTLREGDSIYLRSNIPHKAFNPGETLTTAIMCVTPPVY